MTALQALKQDTRYRNLTVSEQLDVARNVAYKNLQSDPRFHGLSQEEQNGVLTALATKSVTFNDQGLEQRSTQLADSYLQGGAGVNKMASEFGAATFSSSGVLGLASSILQGQETSQDRERLLEYYSNLDALSGRSDIAGEAGSIFGVLADTVVISVAASPLTGLAARGIATAARGGKAVVEGAALLGKAAPVMKPVLNVLGPIASEAFIEAVPYFAISEATKLRKGEKTSMSMGVGEVATTLGTNAAIDFALGTVATGVLMGATRGAKALFFRKPLGSAKDLSPEDLETILNQVELSDQNPSILKQLDPISKDLTAQGVEISRFLKKDALNLDTAIKGRDALLARSLGQIPTVADDGVSPAMWVPNKEGRYVKVPYNSVDHLENELSLAFYRSLKDLEPDEMLAKVRPENSWAFRRGKVLDDNSETLKAATEKSPSFLEGTSPKVRNAITKPEADSLMAAPGKTVIQANIPLQGHFVQNTSKGLYPFIDGYDSIKVSSSDTPNAVFVGSNKAPPEVYEAATVKAQGLLDSGSFKSLEAARSNLLLNAGFDHAVLPDGSVEFFNGRSGRFIAEASVIRTTPGKATQPGNAAVETIFSTQARATIKAAGFIENEEAVLSGVMKVAKTQSPEDITNFTKLYLRSANDLSEVKVTYKSPTQPLVVKRLSDSVVEVQMPRGIGTFKEQEHFVERYLNQLDSITKTPTPAPRLGGSYFAAKLASDPGRFGFADLPNLGGWIRQIAKKLDGQVFRGKEGGVNLALPSGKYAFKSESDAATWLSRHTVDHTVVSKDLWAQGITLKKSPTGTFQVAKAGQKKVFAEASTMDELLDKIDYVPSKLDIRFLPDDIEISPEGFSFSIAGVKTFKKMDQARKYLEKYTDVKELAQYRVLKAVGGNSLSVNSGGVYRVELPSWGIVKQFSDPREARLLLERNITSFNELRPIAFAKGIDFSVEKGLYVVRSGAEKHTAATLEELKGIISKFPDLDESLPHLIDLDPTVTQEVNKLVSAFNYNVKHRVGANPFNMPPEFPIEGRIKELSSWMVLRKVTSEFYTWAVDAAKRTNNPHLSAWTDKFKLASRRSHIDQQRAATYLESVFMGDNGKLMTPESRRKIFYASGAASGSDEAVRLRDMAFKRYGIPPDFELNAQEAAAASKLKDFYQALGRKFNIDYEKLIYDYMPRLRELRDQVSADEINSFAFAEDLVKKVPEWAEGKAPKEVKFWAENTRLDELPEYWLKDDALEVSLLYSSQGHKKLFFNPLWLEIDRLAKETKFDAAIKSRFDMFRMDVMGSYHSPGEKIIEEFGSKAFRSAAEKLNKMGIKVDTASWAETGHNLLRNTLALGQLATMGWKPFLAVRNSFQIYTTLAPRFGIYWTQKAADMVLKDPSPIYERLVARGVISERPPIVNALYSPTSAVGKISKNAFSFFKNSDDLTRAIAYTTGEMRFNNAVTAMRLNQIKSPEEFFSMSGLSRLDPETAGSIFQIANNKWDDIEAVAAASDKFANIVQQKTMFDYSGATAPMYTKGVPGKFFGQYGTFSASFRAAMTDMCKYGSKKEIATSIATYLALSAGLWAGFDALRIRTNDFIPFAPAIFTGGPEFDLFLNGIRSLDTGWEGNQARAAFLRDLPTIIPGAAQVKYAIKTLDYFSKGDTYAALLSATMVPIKPAP